MPANNLEKTASGLKRTGLIVLGIVILIGLYFAFAVTLMDKDSSSLDGTCISTGPRSSDSSCIVLERAVTPSQRSRGLGGRESLPSGHGLLFVFDQPGDHCFWMKDMNFAIDIVWIDEAKKILYKKINVQPSSYPENFCPPSAARYVIEVNAGVARSWQIGAVVYL